MMVVTDRLSKDVVLAGLPDLKATTVVKALITFVVAYHWIPNFITSDRGAQFVSEVWTKLCELIGIERRLSSGYHPEHYYGPSEVSQHIQEIPRSAAD